MLTWDMVNALARDVRANTRRMWRVRGIPHRWRMILLVAAHDIGMKVTPEDFERLELRTVRPRKKPQRPSAPRKAAAHGVRP